MFELIKNGTRRVCYIKKNPDGSEQIHKEPPADGYDIISLFKIFVPDGRTWLYYQGIENSVKGKR